MRMMAKGGKWTEEEDVILKAMAMEFGEDQWVTLSRDLLFRKSPMQCRDRWYKIKAELKLIPSRKIFSQLLE
ncbi:GAMYB transcription factor [Trema orientale]|uniref:GAMYB transcription factor n=1 Tax=Trema orientale TaxID=63057 RepID=A0A2P5EIV2_TREOI|nr:GAMYB transcription factor [Trema orientale]